MKIRSINSWKRIFTDNIAERYTVEIRIRVSQEELDKILREGLKGIL